MCGPSSEKTHKLTVIHVKIREQVSIQCRYFINYSEHYYYMVGSLIYCIEILILWKNFCKYLICEFIKVHTCVGDKIQLKTHLILFIL